MYGFIQLLLVQPSANRRFVQLSPGSPFQKCSRRWGGVLILTSSQAKRQKLSTSGVSCKRLFVPQPALLVRIESDRFFCLDGRFVRLARKVNNGDRSSLPPIQSDTMQSRPQPMLLIFYCQFSFVNEIKLVENY